MALDTRLIYADEKFNSAARALATGAGDIRDRLQVAFSYFWPVKDEDVPADIRDDFRWIMTALTKGRGKEGDGQVEITLRQMHNREATTIAERIWELHRALDQRASAQLGD